MLEKTMAILREEKNKLQNLLEEEEGYEEMETAKEERDAEEAEQKCGNNGEGC